MKLPFGSWCVRVGKFNGQAAVYLQHKWLDFLGCPILIAAQDTYTAAVGARILGQNALEKRFFGICPILGLLLEMLLV